MLQVLCVMMSLLSVFLPQVMHAGVADELLAAGADPTIKNPQGYLPWFIAARRGYKKLATKLLDAYNRAMKTKVQEENDALDRLTCVFYKFNLL